MKLDHEFTVPVPVEQAWPVLLDVEQIGPCMPGATVTKVDGRDFEGKVKVKVGPITVTYNGEASFTEVDEAAKKAVIKAKGKEARGSGTANATVTAQLHDAGESTRVTVTTDLAITGRPAQFGRGVMNDVGAKLLGRFADNLAAQLSSDQGEPEAAAPLHAVPDPAPEPTPADEAEETPTATETPIPESAAEPAAEPVARPPHVTSPTSRANEDDAINLLEAAGPAVLKRLAPAVAALAMLIALIAAVARRRR